MPFPHDHEWKDGVRQPGHLPPNLSYKLSWELAFGVGLVIACTIGVIWITGNNFTGIGVVDDFLLGPLGGDYRQELKINLGK